MPLLNERGNVSRETFPLFTYNTLYNVSRETL